MNYKEAIAKLRQELGTWYGDGQCYGTVGYYIYLICGKTIKYDLGYPMMTKTGSGMNAWEIGHDWDFKSEGFEVLTPDYSKLREGTIINIGPNQGGPVWWSGYEGHTAVIVSINQSAGICEVIDSNYGVGSNGQGSASNLREYRLDSVLTGIYSMIVPPNSDSGILEGIEFKNPDIQVPGFIGANSKPNDSGIRVDIDKTADTISTNFIKLLSDLIEGICHGVYSNCEEYYTNEVLNLVRIGNVLKPKLNDDAVELFKNTAIDSIKNSLKNINLNLSTPPNSVNPQLSKSVDIPDKEDSIEERIRLIVKMCIKHNPSSTAYGITGVIGNFLAEANIDPTNFEAKYLGSHVNTPSSTVKPTAEELYGSWESFRGLYSFPLNEQAYLSNGQHWIGCGLGQWTGPRAEKLYRYAESNGLNMWTVKTQMEFAFSESEEGNVTILQQCLTNSHSIEEGVRNFYTLWERANVSDSYQKRIDAANQYHDLVLKYMKE